MCPKAHILMSCTPLNKQRSSYYSETAKFTLITNDTLRFSKFGFASVIYWNYLKVLREGKPAQGELSAVGAVAWFDTSVSLTI